MLKIKSELNRNLLKFGIWTSAVMASISAATGWLVVIIWMWMMLFMLIGSFEDENGIRGIASVAIGEIIGIMPVIAFFSLYADGRSALITSLLAFIFALLTALAIETNSRIRKNITEKKIA